MSSLQKTGSKPDTFTIKQINKLAASYYGSHPDSTLYYGKLEINLSKKINYPNGIANGTLQIASVNTFNGNYPESIKNYNAALKIYQQQNNKKGISDSYNGLGRVEDFMGNYDIAIAYYQKALAWCVITPDEADEGEVYNLLGITYDNKGDFSKALDYYFKALLINIKHNDQDAAANKYSNIGVIMQELEMYQKALSYYNRALVIWEKKEDQQGISTACQDIGDLYITQKDYKRAKPYLDRAHGIFRHMKDKEGLALVYYDMGLYKYYIKRPDSAIYYLQESLKLGKQSNSSYVRAYAYQGLAVVYNWDKKYQLAYNYAVKAEDTGIKLNNLILKTDASQQLSMALAGLKRFEEAYKEHVAFSGLRSDLKHSESIHKAIFYNLELEFAKKQNELMDRQHKKEEVYKARIANQSNENLISAIIILVLIIIVLIYYNAKIKQQRINKLLAGKNQEITQQQEDLNSQAAKLNELNILKDRLIGVLAHDLRAPISTLRGLFTLMTDASISGEEFIEMTPKVFNRLENTSDFLDTLLFWINSQVDGTNNKAVNFSLADLTSREIQHLEDKIQQKNLTIQQDIPQDAIALADPNSVRIVIHNFLTNAIKFSNRDGTIEISSWIENEGIAFCLKDHGVGMSAEYLNTLFKSQVNSSAGTENEVGTGMGLLFCKDLIQNQGGKIWARSVLGTGTELCFMLPLGNKAD
ncbi:tetratricopeptide repeat protein [Mucilaginibacter sp. dw_454]|uniref:tetratricopeptide repeat-containing sensor histidine kinase n=1 Tax=Mucilaginibacter sp. dw_454 TaxID=2720079 RepID=UPI001BD5BBDB|nr:tetratricopeptide repeat protein [Mucilaginibacter sp. dw_454]